MATSLFSAAAQRIAEGLDRAFTTATLSRGGNRARDHAQLLTMLELVTRFYDRPEHFVPGASFFPTPAAITPEVRRLRSFGRDGDVFDLRWPSAFEPLWSDQALAGLLAESPGGAARLAPAAAPRLDARRTLREKYLGVAANRTAAARWFRHRSGQRACAVLLHGYMGGTFTLEERLFPVRKLFAGGMDVVLTALPFHGSRRDERRGLRPPAFPSSDPRFTIEAFRQLVLDHRALFDHLERSGAGELGVMGTSLGGYASALLATLEPRLRFAVLFIPLGSLEQFYFDHGAITGDPDQQEELRRALRRAQSVISPCARPPLVPSERVRVVAGELDRVTGIAHSRLLAEHFGVDVDTFAGGHVLQLGKTLALEPAFAMLQRAGLFQQPWG
jgi:pimeloyl-ACP methyl ester carboxylesterase